jgi:fibronectin type 3 domain-containing protein
VSTIDQTAADYAVSGITFPTTISAGQSADFTVTFAPQTAGSSPGTITFVSNANSNPTLTLTGAGTQTVNHTVSLSWADSQQVTGYNVYRGTSAGGPYVKQTTSLLTTAAYVDSTVQSGATYYYVATAVDANGESGYSNQASAVIP